MSEIIFGVDISKDHLDANRLPDQAARQFNNTKAGVRAFLAWVGGVRALTAAPGARRLAVTRGLGVAPWGREAA